MNKAEKSGLHMVVHPANVDAEVLELGRRIWCYLAARRSSFWQNCHPTDPKYMMLWGKERLVSELLAAGASHHEALEIIRFLEKKRLSPENPGPKLRKRRKNLEKLRGFLQFA